MTKIGRIIYMVYDHKLLGCFGIIQLAIKWKMDSIKVKWRKLILNRMTIIKKKKINQNMSWIQIIKY
jgi:hypothetical protein